MQYRVNNAFGNQYLRLIRSEVKALLNEKYGNDYLKKNKLKKKLAQTNKELRRLKSQMASLEQKKAELLVSLDKYA